MSLSRALAWCLVATIFVVDAIVARGVSIPCLYLAPLAIAGRANRRRELVAAAVTCSALTVAGGVLSHVGAASWMVVTNRAIALFVIWIATAWMLRALASHEREARRADLAQASTETLARRHVDEARRARAMASMMEDLRRERERLGASDARFRATIECAPTAMIMVDAYGTIVLVNRETEALFGYERHELLGQSIEVLVPDRARASHPTLRQDYFARPRARRIGVADDGLAGRRKDGSEIPVEIGLNPVRTDDGVYVLSAITDVTERHRHEQDIKAYADELRRSNLELDRFAYSASHDLKAPLRAVDSLAGFVLEDATDSIPASSRENLLLMKSRIRRMERLLNDLLDYSRVGREAENREEVDVGDLVRSVADLISPPAGIEVTTGDLPCVCTDRAPLAQVLRNLIENAVKHHDRDVGRIEVNGSVANGALRLTVADDGPGIPPAFHDRVFQLFETLRPRDDVEGSGMGLAIVRKTIEQRDGSIAVHSDGRGTTFVIHWPLQWNRDGAQSPSGEVADRA